MAVLQRLVGRIEDLDGLDRLGRPLAAQARRATRSRVMKNALSGTWLGHPLHPMLTDVPIGAWVMAGLLDVLGGSAGQLAARRLVGLGVLAAIPTAAAGSSDWAETEAGDQRVGLVHGLGNLTVVALQAGSYLARRRGQRGTGVCLSASGLGLMMGTAYLGGHLSFSRGVGVNHTAFQKLVTQWTDVASVTGLAPGTPFRVAADGVPVVLVRREEKIYALSATCVHAGGPLDEGQLLGECVRCPWHGSTFRLSDGTALRGPAAAGQPSWQVRVQGDRIQVRSGMPGRSPSGGPARGEEKPATREMPAGRRSWSYSKDIKPLFRKKDRESMKEAFDLWDYNDVKNNAQAILARLRAGDMPCDRAWPQSRVQAFQDWVGAGTPP